MNNQIEKFSTERCNAVETILKYIKEENEEFKFEESKKILDLLKDIDINNFMDLIFPCLLIINPRQRMALVNILLTQDFEDAMIKAIPHIISKN